MFEKLTAQHAKEILSENITIGSAYSADKSISKSFVFNPWEDVYKVINHGKVIDSGYIVEDLLDVYNSI